MPLARRARPPPPPLRRPLHGGDRARLVDRPLALAPTLGTPLLSHSPAAAFIAAASAIAALAGARRTPLYGQRGRPPRPRRPAPSRPRLRSRRRGRQRERQRLAVGAGAQRLVAPTDCLKPIVTGSALIARG